ncbi:MAG: right-handed parallel beta-helix repeat-containing protein [Candidatus Omnitrophota bacterium]|nr:right-handed parallel beta-helix repeat-containing protein [Candidatus Omnitrophota bacterium]
MKLNRLTTILLVTGYWLVVAGSVSSAFAQKLSVDGDIDTPSLYLTPKTSAPSPAGPEGQIYYDTTENDVYISDAAQWNTIALPMNVATIIVAASDSLDKNKAEASYQCTGTDDQVKINAAIAACPASGGAVYLLEGTYDITMQSGQTQDNAGIILNRNNISLIGAGNGTILKKRSAAETQYYIINATSASNLLISQLQLDGSETKSAGIYFDNVTYSKIDKVWIRGTQGGRAGIYCTNSNNNIISNAHIDLGNPSENADGLELVGTSSNNIVSHNYISRCSEGELYLGRSSQNNIVSDNILIGGDVGGAPEDDPSEIYASLWDAGTNNIISNNIVSANKTGGIWADGDRSIVSGNSVTGGAREGIALWGDKDVNPGLPDSPWGKIPNYSIISNNVIANNRHEGILFNAGVGQLISGNALYDNGQTGAFNGIFVDGASGAADDKYDNNLISGNLIYDSVGTGYGIKIPSNSDNNYLVTNYITGAAFATNKIDDLGVNTKYTGKEKITFEPITVDITASGQIVYPAGKTSGSPVYSPSSHIILNNISGSDQTITLENGKSQGDLLILRCKDLSLLDPITVQNGGNVDIGANRALDNDDVLELIWNGTQWLGLSE